MYKIREYYKSGFNKGVLKEERYFEECSEVIKEYYKLFNYNDFSLNPTVWVYDEENNKWNRISEDELYKVRVAMGYI